MTPQVRLTKREKRNTSSHRFEGLLAQGSSDRDQCSRVRAAVGVTGLWGGPAGRMKAGTGCVHHCLFRGDRSGLPGRQWRRTRANYTRGDGKGAKRRGGRYLRSDGEICL